MKFVVSSSALLNMLQATGKVISNKNTLPILDYFLFELKDNTLTITGSDLETTLIGKIKIENAEQEGIIAVPAKLILDTLKEFSEQPLTIQANTNTWEITVSWKSGKLTIPGTSGMSYPTPTNLGEDAISITIDPSILLNGISKTIFATADDELRPVMNGIFMNLEGGELTFVATDAHKLVKYSFKGIDSSDTKSFIVPKKPAILLKSILGKEDEDIKMEFDEKNARFNLKNYTVICRLIEGKYPNYKAVIPTNNPNKILVDKAEMINAIKRVAVCSNQATNMVKFSIENNNINLTAQDLDFSVSAEEAVPCQYEGSQIEIGFKSTFLVELMNNIETENLTIELADSTRAGLFMPSENEENQDLLMLLMPMLING